MHSSQPTLGYSHGAAAWGTCQIDTFWQPHLLTEGPVSSERGHNELVPISRPSPPADHSKSLLAGAPAQSVYLTAWRVRPL